MRLAVCAEGPDEARVAATPETVKRYTVLGFGIDVQTGAGARAGFRDSDYESAGATLVADGNGTVKEAGVVLAVHRPAEGLLASCQAGAVLIGHMDPYDSSAALQTLAQANVTAIGMELMPRITRAQGMDVLSSQANLAGYRAVIEAAAAAPFVLPLMMTAAGTVPAARVFVMGAGVAGLQAIATARRLGAVVTATDVRPAAKEQVHSLGAKFIAVEDDEFREAETAAGYAKPMSDTYRQKQAALVAAHIAKQDLVITTALIPGKPAPRLVSEEMIASMRPGAVVVDLAVERGGNVAYARAGETIVHQGVTIIGGANFAGQVAASASSLYARNLYHFIDAFWNRDTKTFNLDPADPIIAATLLTAGGAVVHPHFKPAEGAA